MNSYELSRTWFNYCFLNPEKVKPNHTAIYFFAIEHCNRLGWKEKFGFPTTMVMEAIGIKSYNTYIKSLNEIIDFGFIKMIEKSKNQFSANIIALSNFNKALDKALDKALIKHGSKQSESTVQSIDSIIKQVTKKQYNNEQITRLHNYLGDLLKIKSINSNNEYEDFINQFHNDQWFEEVAMQLSITPNKVSELAKDFESDRKIDGSYTEKSLSELKNWFYNFAKKKKDTATADETPEEKGIRLLNIANSQK